jgi:hypothetical protein
LNTALNTSLGHRDAWANNIIILVPTNSPLASADGIMLVVARVDPPGVSGTERRRKRARGAPQAATSLSTEQRHF